MKSNRAEQDTSAAADAKDLLPSAEASEHTRHNVAPENPKVGHLSQTVRSQNIKEKQTYTTENVEIEAYWVERKRYLQQIRNIPELKRKYVRSVLAYIIRRFLWSFTFFPVFIAVWIPLVLNRFNIVVTLNNVIPSLQAFVEANPQSQAATIETLIIAWFSIGITFAIFDFILTPFKNPYAYEADVHMRTWEELHMRQTKK